MFQAIDRNHNGEIDKAELRSAFAQSGVTVSSAKLDNFFAEVDKNNDGVISYAEWRFVENTCPRSCACLDKDTKTSESQEKELQLTQNLISLPF
jgi:ribosomal protein L12E/L44/L45/RPP1/RPP2